MPLEKRLQGKRIAIFAEDIYEDLELWYPLLRLQEEGAETVVVGPGDAKEHHGKYGYPVTVDKAIQKVDVEQFDALVIREDTPRIACAAMPPWWPLSGRWPNRARSWPPSVMALGCWPPPKWWQARPSPPSLPSRLPGPCRSHL